MSATKDDYGLTTSRTDSLLKRLRDIDNHYLMRAQDHSTLKRAQDFIKSVWILHVDNETVPREKLAELFDAINLR